MEKFFNRIQNFADKHPFWMILFTMLIPLVLVLIGFGVIIDLGEGKIVT